MTKRKSEKTSLKQPAPKPRAESLRVSVIPVLREQVAAHSKREKFLESLVQTQERVLSQAHIELKRGLESLQDHLTAAHNYEEWSRLQMADRDRQIAALLRRIDYLTDAYLGLANPRKSD